MIRTPTDRQFRDLEQGRITTVGTFTVTASAATTTVEHQGVSDNSCIVLTPSNAAMATEWATTVPYVSSQGRGQFVVTHANNANVRTIRYVFFSPLSR